MSPRGAAVALPIIDEDLLARLLALQFPGWARLPITKVRSPGTDNEIFRLGGDMSVRMPKVDWAVGQGDKEYRWLSKLAHHLPLAIPEPLAMGSPDSGYPWPWTVHTWLDGETAAPERLADQGRSARQLAEFVAALRRVDTGGGPLSGRHNHFRGADLAILDAKVRTALKDLEGRIDSEAAAVVWRAALAAPPWHGDGVWLHGDLHAANVIARGGELSAVIDFGLMGVGDPATDLMAAWSMFDKDARSAFREVVDVDDATWTRGRGWALYSGVIALPFYWETNAAVVAGGLKTIAEVLADANAM